VEPKNPDQEGEFGPFSDAKNDVVTMCFAHKATFTDFDGGVTSIFYQFRYSAHKKGTPLLYSENYLKPMATPWTPPANPSPNLRTALAYISAMEQWDTQRLMHTFDQTLEHQILPRSLERPLLFKNQYQDYFQGLRKMFHLQKPLKVGFYFRFNIP
jgi:hypothetical protein